MKRTRTTKIQAAPAQKTKQSKHAKTSQSRDNKLIIYAVISVLLSTFTGYFLFPDMQIAKKTGLDSSILYFALIASSGILFWIISRQKKQAAKYFFLLILLILSGLSFYTSETTPASALNLILNLNYIFQILIPAGVLSGSWALFFHKDILNTHIGNLYPEKNKDKCTLFSLSKKQGPYTLAFLLIIILATILLSYRLDYFDLYSDEAQVTEGAASYYYTGHNGQWDFIKDKPKNTKYQRAWPHLKIVSWSYHLFGISNWSSRIVSVFFGLIFIILLYPVSRHFARDTLPALFVLLSVIFYFEYMQLLRWARMYAMLFPVYLISGISAYKLLTEDMPDYLKSKIPNKIIVFLNFNPKYLLLFLISTYFAFILHPNALIILLTIFAFSLISILTFHDKKHLTVIIIALIGFLIAISLPQYSRFLDRFTAFEAQNVDIYTNVIFNFPFGYRLNLLLSFTGLSFFIIIKHKSFTQKLIFLYLSLFLTWLLFSYIFVYAPSFRYIGISIAFAIILFLMIWNLILKTLFHKYLQIALWVLMFANISVQFYSVYDNLYETNYYSVAKPSKAYPTIVKNYKKGELLLMHWGPRFYLDDIDSSAELASLGSYKPVKFKNTYDAIHSHTGSWLTWHSQYTNRINPMLRAYADKYFVKYHGYGIDSTFTEVYYADFEMLKDSLMFLNLDRYVPSANLNLEHPYSLSFFIESPKTGSHIPLYYSYKTDTLAYVEILPDESKIVYVRNDSILLKADFPKDDNLHHVVLFSDNNTLAFSTDGKITSAKTAPAKQNYVKIGVNIKYLAKFDNLRLYNQKLSSDEISQLRKIGGNMLLKPKDANNQDINALYKWDKN